ncbi:hypothetical protein DYBT9623_00865 [Dyadobacter sp. CECT 9623]|jgi:hypothetical protein|uniref:Uncharacterized protein n=1 Tax=Dyadobacter linearis TaxID=2823330 RepID=A0ABM8UKY9_9BACT|nr:hypothetical protein DYBT9623_00865 [Dyadobacter sp. CECT 9623]
MIKYRIGIILKTEVTNMTSFISRNNNLSSLIGASVRSEIA